MIKFIREKDYFISYCLAIFYLWVLYNIYTKNEITNQLVFIVLFSLGDVVNFCICLFIVGGIIIYKIAPYDATIPNLLLSFGASFIISCLYYISNSNSIFGED